MIPLPGRAASLPPDRTELPSSDYTGILHHAQGTTRNRDANDRVAQSLQRILHVQRDEEFVFDDQDAKRTGIHGAIAVVLGWVIAAARGIGGKPKLRG